MKVCTDWEKIEIFKDVCKKYAQKDVYEKQCTKWENQQTGTSQVCSQTVDEDVFTQVCVKNEDVISEGLHEARSRLDLSAGQHGQRRHDAGALLPVRRADPGERR